jgi:hypothetical protein
MAAVCSIIQTCIDYPAPGKAGGLIKQFLLSALVTFIGTIGIGIMVFRYIRIHDGGWGWGYIGGIFLCIWSAVMIYNVSLCLFGVLLGRKKKRHAMALAASVFLPALIAVTRPVYSSLLEAEWEIWDSALKQGTQGYDVEYYTEHLSCRTRGRLRSLLGNLDAPENIEFSKIPSDTLDILYQLNFGIAGCPTLTEDLARKIYRQQYPRWKSGWASDNIPRFASNESLPPDIQAALIDEGEVYYLSRNKSLAQEHIARICDIILSEKVIVKGMNGGPLPWSESDKRHRIDIAANLFRNPNTPVGCLRKLCQSSLYHPGSSMAYGLVFNPNCPDDIKCEIISHAD